MKNTVKKPQDELPRLRQDDASKSASHKIADDKKRDVHVGARTQQSSHQGSKSA